MHNRRVNQEKKDESGVTDDDGIEDIYRLMSGYQMRIMAGMIPRPTNTPLLQCPDSFPPKFKKLLAGFTFTSPFH